MIKKKKSLMFFLIYIDSGEKLPYLFKFLLLQLDNKRFIIFVEL